MVFNKIYLPTLLGVEALTSSELQDLGYQKSQITVDDGEVTLFLDSNQEAANAIAELNFNLRTAERVLLGLAEFNADSFEQLYDKTFNLPWHEWVDYQYYLEIVGYSRKSALHSIPACQRIIKKALIDKLNLIYGYPDGVVPEDQNAGNYRIQFSIINNKVKIRLDTTGDPLHKRGYRPITHEAPLRETLAAAILLVSFYKRNIKNGEVLYDPFCGSGTFLIEAALIGSNTAPGLQRHFAGEEYCIIGRKVFDRARELAKRKSLIYNPDLLNEVKLQDVKSENNSFNTSSHIYPGLPPKIFGSDISRDNINLAKENAKRAGVDDLILFEKQDIYQLKRVNLLEKFSTDRILFVANPPYGERMADQEEAEKLANQLCKLCLNEKRFVARGTRLSVLTPDDDFETIMGFKANRRRKLYNGGIRCTLFHYFNF
ncbi:MAG TPA: class I SAM-dependent RNA methyltransferase [Clostridiaceae bacterium]|nr:class I SAM-dependent RNA methyltransferase [Clostridiaceae bacterium]